MCVFIAGNTYVGVVGARARKSDVWTLLPSACDNRRSNKGPHCKVIANTMRNLRKRVGRAWGYEDDVRPSAKFDVEDWITNLIVRL